MIRLYAFSITLALACCHPMAAQFENVPEFTPSVRLDLAEIPDLERADNLIASKQWDQAIETLRRVMEEQGDNLIRLPELQTQSGRQFARYVTVRRFCHFEIGGLSRIAPEALKTYRRRVDPLAKQWFERAAAAGDVELFQQVVDQLFNSSYGDDALLHLGDLALQRGQPARARWCWERISPALRFPNPKGAFPASAGQPIWLALSGVDIQKQWTRLGPLLAGRRGRTNWLAYPDSDIDLAKVRARLILVSLLERSFDRVKIEMEVFRRLHPEAEGKLGGKRGRLVELLDQSIQAARKWPAISHDDSWRSFAGGFSRQHIAASTVDVAGHARWSDISLPRWKVEKEMHGFGRARVSESADGLLSYHPIVLDLPETGPIVIWNQASLVRAIRLDNGQAAWPLGTEDDSNPRRKGVIYDAERTTAQLFPGTRRFVGAPRFTLSAFNDKLFVRMGGLRTSSRDEIRATVDQSVIVGLDLSGQGRLLPGFELRPEGLDWQFEGSPVCDGRELFVAVRRSTPQGALPELHVSAYPLQVVEQGAKKDRPPRWRTKVCAANTPAGGIWDEVTGCLLTLSEDRIFCNSNLGAVASIRTDGRLRWLTTYPRSAFRPRDPDQSDLHYLRDRNPCLLFEDYVIVAPCDSDKVFALDANTGQLRWQVSLPGVVYLLGVGHGNLLAGGDALYWIDVRNGRHVGHFPQAARRPKPDLARIGLPGYGRGVLAGDSVYWPTREHIFVFKQQTQRRTTADGRILWQPIGVRRIDLRPRNIEGGNLVISDGVLLVAGPDGLAAFDQRGPPPDR